MNDFNNEMTPDLRAASIFRAVQKSRQARIDEINAAFDDELRKADAAARTHDLIRAYRSEPAQHRALSFTRSDLTNLDTKARTVELSFASEYPVLKRNLNVLEVLQMTSVAANLKRLNGAGALLWCHRKDDQIGVVLKAWIDAANKRARAVVKFSSSVRGQEFFQDVQDGIIRSVSFGYAIINGKITAGTRGSNKPDIFTATSWEATEISLVSVPADPTIGVGRSERLRSESN